jgi:hypothetical protein
MMDIVARNEEISVGVYEMQIETLADECGEEGDEDEQKSAERRIEDRHRKVRHVGGSFQRNICGNMVMEQALFLRPAVWRYLPVDRGELRPLGFCGVDRQKLASIARCDAT